MADYIVALYQDFNDASSAIRDLVNNGFDNKDISFVVRDQNGDYAKKINQQGYIEGSKQPLNAGTGTGQQHESWLDKLLADLGIISIPGVGNSMTAGPITGLMKGTGDLVGALTKAGIPNDSAQEYAEGVRRGDSLVLVKSPEDRTDQAVNILNNHNPIDIDTQAKQWRQANWQGFNQNAQPLTQEQINQERRNYQQTLQEGGETTLPVVEEELRVGKREVDTGGVRIHTYTTEEPVDQTVNLREEHVDVERHPVDRPATDQDLNAFQEGTLDVTEHAEEAVVDKKAHVVEEVTVNKDVEERPENIHDTVRKTNVDVEQLGQNQQVNRTQQTNVAGFEQFDPMFQNHFQMNYAGTNYTYDQFRPYYEFGYDLGANDAHQGESWNQAEQDARRQWEQNYPNMSWEQYRDAVHAGFEAAQQGQAS